MVLFYLLILHLISNENSISGLMFSDCKHLILPPLCQCYHSGEESQLRCRDIQLNSLPKLPNNMRWYALDFSSNNITSIDSYVLSDIYVEKLSLNSNSLHMIDVTAFNQIQNLKKLYINHNHLNEFDPKILTSPGVSLEIFDISYNPFEYLDLGEIFLHLPILREFYAVSCQLTNSSLYTLSKLTEHHHHYMRIIDLGSNDLTSLCNNLFDGFLNLIELRLNNNNIYLIDNYFIQPLKYLRILNLAFNSIEYLPNLFSSSLETLNLSSNNIRYLNDYFASNLPSIRVIDVDLNNFLNSISPYSFCFVNTLLLEKLSFRYNTILSVEIFSELLCRLLDKENTNYRSILDLNQNINLQCNCMLMQFEKYLINYSDLTCIKQEQDRYFISKLTNLSSICIKDFCIGQQKEILCEWNDAKRLTLEGTCQAKLIENQNSTKNGLDSIKSTNYSKLWDNTYENSTGFNGKRSKSILVSMKRLDYIWFFLLLVLLYI